jgi:SPASM domain peptide maturase of grasp-with-spasm system
MSEIYMLFSNCITVKGANRSALYDVQRTRYRLTTNFVAEKLLLEKGKIMTSKVENEFKEYLDELVKDEWGIYINKSMCDLFPTLDLSWDHYAKITNAQIDFKNNTTDIVFFFDFVLPQFEELFCKNFQINFVEPISYKELLDFLTRFDDTCVNLVSVVAPYFILTMDESKKLFESQPRLGSVFFYNSPNEDYPQINDIFYSQNDISLRNKNIISTEYFTTNISLFTESQNHNTYYNRKLCIDSEGNIKNSPEHEKTFENIKNTQLKDVIERPEFKNLWNIHKEMIDVCKDCEFRHMCVDASKLIERKNGTWYRETECNYNPYICRWEGETDYLTLNESGVTVNENGFSIDDQKLKIINDKVWSDD